jgi:chromate reductase
MRLLAINGSLRQGSYNGMLLDAAAAQLRPPTELVRLHGLGALPPYSEDLDPGPSPVLRLREEIARSDAILVATPEYNGSIPGTLKNALDWASRPYPDNCLRGKPAAVVGASTGVFGAVWAQAELRKVLRTIGASVLGQELSVPTAQDAFTCDGRLREPRLAQALRGVVGELVRSALSEAA